MSYLYQLPYDEHKAIIDAITLGSIDALIDFASCPCKGRQAVCGQAAHAYEQAHLYLKGLRLSNHESQLKPLIIAHYTEAHLTRQAHYRLFPACYTRDMQAWNTHSWAHGYMRLREHYAHLSMQMLHMIIEKKP